MTLFTLLESLKCLYFFNFQLKNDSIDGVAELKMIIQLEFFALTMAKSLV